MTPFWLARYDTPYLCMEDVDIAGLGYFSAFIPKTDMLFLIGDPEMYNQLVVGLHNFLSTAPARLKTSLL